MGTKGASILAMSMKILSQVKTAESGFSLTGCLYDPIAVKILRQNLNCFWPFLVQKSKNPHYNNLFIFRFFSKIILMRIFVFLNIFCRQKIPFWRKLMVFYFFMFRIFFKNYSTHAVFQFFVIFFITENSVSDAQNENSESSENAENPHQNFDCYGVIQQRQWQWQWKSCQY